MATDDVVRLTQKVADLRRQLDQANEKKTDFISVICHELRTPLTGLVGYCDLLQAGKLGGLTEDQRQVVGSMAGQVARMRRIVESLITTAMLARGAVALSLQACDLAVLIDEVVAEPDDYPERPRRRVEQRRTQLPLVICDREKIRQVLLDLLDNAAKFSPEARPVIITLDRDGDFARLVVSDYGTGIKAEDQKLVFENFVQLENAATRSCAGLGLGLAKVKGLVGLHGGTVAVASPSRVVRESGVAGTDIVVCIPL